MSDAVIQVPPNSTGEKVDTEQLTVGLNTVQRQRIQIAGTSALEIAPVSATNGLAVDSKTLAPDAATETTLGEIAANALDYDTGGGTVAQVVLGLALPGAGGPVAGGTATNPIQVSLANTAANATAVKVDGSAVTQPVSAVALPLPSGAATSALQTQPGVDIGDVTVNNAGGGAAVNIQDGGNTITVDGTVLTSNWPSTVDTNSGNKSASSPRFVIATDDINLAAINAVNGTTAGAAVITDANGTIQQYLRGLVKLAITAGGFLVTATLNASTTLIGYTGRKFTVGNIATLTTTNFSGLTNTSGWQSAAIAPTGASDIIFSLTTLGAAGSTLLVDFYIAETNGTSYTDGATGSEGTFTAANRKNSRYLGSLQLNTTNSVVGELRLSDIMLCPNSSIALLAINNSGGTISVTGGNTVFTYQLVY